MTRNEPGSLRKLYRPVSAESGHILEDISSTISRFTSSVSPFGQITLGSILPINVLNMGIVVARPKDERGIPRKFLEIFDPHVEDQVSAEIVTNPLKLRFTQRHDNKYLPKHTPSRHSDHNPKIPGRLSLGLAPCLEYEREVRAVSRFSAPMDPIDGELIWVEIAKTNSLIDCGLARHEDRIYEVGQRLGEMFADMLAAENYLITFDPPRL